MKRLFCCFGKRESVIIDARETLRVIKSSDLPTYSYAGQWMIGKVLSIYDGDTCHIALINYDKFLKLKCRLAYIDTPELKPLKAHDNRLEEMSKAMKARNRLVQLATSCQIDVDSQMKGAELQKLLDASNNKLVAVECGQFDKYGRLLVVIYDYDPQTFLNIPRIENSYNARLVLDGFAKLYDGGTKEAFAEETMTANDDAVINAMRAMAGGRG